MPQTLFNIKEDVLYIEFEQLFDVFRKHVYLAEIQVILFDNDKNNFISLN